MSTSIMSTYQRQTIGFDHGQGAWLYDTEGKKYLDAFSGIAVCSLGHAHPAITQAICDQAGKLLHTSNAYQIPLQEKLATELVRLSHMEQVFFCNSGGEANETAIKLTRMIARKKNISHPVIAVANKAFHGRTMGTLSASHEKIHGGFEPLLNEYIRIPFGNMTALKALAENKNIVAVMLEPVLGEGGVHVPDSHYLKQVRQICDECDWLMILDEIQTGIGRTGKWFAHQHAGILPDVMTLAKALGNGIPIGACLTRGKANDLLPPGKHGSTFGGNPFACRVGLAVLQTMEQEKVIENAARMGDYLKKNLQEALSGLPAVKDIRGIGLIIGIELDRPCRELIKVGIKNGILLNVTSECVIRVVPPLIINQSEADEIVNRLKKSIEEFVK